MILCISVLSVVISSFSFLILLIWFFSLFFLMSLANNGLSILLIFSKSYLLALLILAMVSFVSFTFISALIFMISFRWTLQPVFLCCFDSVFLKVCLNFQLLGYVWLFATPRTAASQASLSITNSQNLLKLMSIESTDSIQPSYPLSSPSSPAFNVAQHQDIFQWVSSSHQVAKVLELQLQPQSFLWVFRTDSL